MNTENNHLSLRRYESHTINGSRFTVATIEVRESPDDVPSHFIIYRHSDNHGCPEGPSLFYYESDELMHNAFNKGLVAMLINPESENEKETESPQEMLRVLLEHMNIFGSFQGCIAVAKYEAGEKPWYLHEDNHDSAKITYKKPA